LVANGAIERVIDQKKLYYTRACFQQIGRGKVLHFHAIHHRGAARSHRLGHGARIFLTAFGHLYDASAAVSTAGFEFGMVAHRRRHNVASYHACSLKDGCAIGHFNADSVYCNFCHLYLTTPECFPDAEIPFNIAEE
jgi:hypothetical protein